MQNLFEKQFLTRPLKDGTSALKCGKPKDKIRFEFYVCLCHFFVCFVILNCSYINPVDKKKPKCINLCTE